MNRSPHPKPVRASAVDAEAVAIEALGFVAADPVLMPRFLAITGLEPSSIRRAAAEPGFLAGVLKFLLDHEPSLDAFCVSAGIAPEAVAAALSRLPGGDDRHDRST